MKRNKIGFATAAALLAISGAALAQGNVTATTDLNVRAGPGPEHPVIGVINVGQGAELGGCIQDSKWCTVAFNGGEGWVYSDYLAGDFGGEKVVLSQRSASADVRIVPGPSTDGQTTGAVTGAVAGAIGGAIIGGPVGAAVGGVAGGLGGAATGTVIDPPSSVRSYVSEQQVDPVYLEGEVVVGATLPEAVELRQVPDYEYRYVLVNGQRVLVEPQSRQIVYVLR